MNEPYRIGLAGPWEWWPADDSAARRRCALPRDWPLLAPRLAPNERPPPIRLARRFGRPTNLEPGERVTLVIEPLPPAARVLLNGAELDPPAGNAYRQPVTERLLNRNELLLELNQPATGPAPDVRLEITRGAAEAR